MKKENFLSKEEFEKLTNELPVSDYALHRKIALALLVEIAKNYLHIHHMDVEKIKSMFFNELNDALSNIPKEDQYLLKLMILGLHEEFNNKTIKLVSKVADSKVLVCYDRYDKTMLVNALKVLFDCAEKQPDYDKINRVILDLISLSAAMDKEGFDHLEFVSRCEDIDKQLKLINNALFTQYVNELREKITVKKGRVYLAID